jgi:RNA polymerase sigma-70 factor (ECF subfamily)
MHWWRRTGSATAEADEPVSDGREVLAPEMELVRRCQGGERAAFEELVLTYQPRLLSYLNRLVGPEMAEDLLQETFLRVWRALPAFRGDSSFDTWIFRIATNLVRDFARRRKARPEMLIPPVASSDDGDGAAAGSLDGLTLEAFGADERDVRQLPEEALHQRELHDNLERALNELSQAHRATILLHDLFGFRYEEIADIMHCPVGTVKSRLFYARSRIRQMLERTLPAKEWMG